MSPRALRLEALEERTLLNAGPVLAVNPNAYDPGHLLVRVEPGAAPPGPDARPIGGLVPGLYEVSLAPGVSVPRALAAYKADPHVLSAEPDYALKVSQVPNDPQLGQQWDMPKTGAPAAWDVTTGSPSVVVAV